MNDFSPFENLVSNLRSFCSGVVDIFVYFFDEVAEEPSKVLVTFVVGAPLAILGVHIINRVIRVKDND